MRNSECVIRNYEQTERMRKPVGYGSKPYRTYEQEHEEERKHDKCEQTRA